MTIRTIARFALCVFVGLSISCGGDKNAETPISKDALFSALPSGALMIYSISPQAIADNPLIDELRTALRKTEDELPFTAAAAQVGLDPNADVERMDWALYGLENNVANIGMIITGNFTEETILQKIAESSSSRLRAQIEERTYLKQTFYELTRSSGQRIQKDYIRFPEPNILIATTNEAIMQKSIVVGRGRAEGMDNDPRLAPVLKEVSTTSPAWIAGLAQGTLERLNLTVRFSRGESLGRGVKSYHGAVILSPDRIQFGLTFDTDNSEAAQRQATNYDAIKVSQAQAYVPFIGKAAVDLANQMQVEAKDASVVANLELTADEVDAISAEIEKALAAGPQLSPMLQQELLGQTTQPATEPTDSQ